MKPNVVAMPQRWFAWRPVRLVDGRWVWLRPVLRRWWVDTDAYTWVSDGSCWHYEEMK